MKKRQGSFIIFISLMLLCDVVITAQEPLAPWYPPQQRIDKYVPERFIPTSEATISISGKELNEKSFSSKISLNGMWRFSGIENSKNAFADNADLDKMYMSPSFDDSSWEDIPVPLNWYVQYPTAMLRDMPYVKGWYRKTIDIPDTASVSRIMLHFGVIGYEARLYIDGKEAGSHKGDFTPWTIDITKLVKPGTRALIAVRVFSDFGPAHGVSLPAKHAYGTQWVIGNIKAGIWQDAELRIEPEIRPLQVQVVPDLSKSSVKIVGIVRNDSTNERKVNMIPAIASAISGEDSTSILSPAISLVLQPGDNFFDVEVKLNQPELWTPASPYLHHLFLSVIENGEAIALKTIRFGFRSFHAKGGKFFLNGQRTYLFGEQIVAVEFGGIGKTADEDFKRAVQIMQRYKELGCNIVRTASMPPVPAILKAADEVGMMIYNEWAWNFASKLDPVEFERNSLYELQEWFWRDCNHASVVMWSCGNEVGHNDPIAHAILDKQVEMMRRIDISGRPVGSFSGSGNIGFGKNRLETDVLDLHNYYGIAGQPWSFLPSRLDKVYNDLCALYAPGKETLPVPLIIWECIGYNWGWHFDKNFIPNDATAYLAWTKKPFSWNKPNAVGWSGSIGLAAALDSKRGPRTGINVIGRNIIDAIRKDIRITGFAPWVSQLNMMEAATLWNQPIYCSLSGPGDIPLRNVFAGEKYQQRFVCVNSTDESIDDATIKVSLVENAINQSLVVELKNQCINAWNKLELPIDISIPMTKVSHWAQLRIQLITPNGNEISRNFYDIFIQPPQRALSPINNFHTVGVLACGATGEAALDQILVDLQAKKVVVVNKPADLSTLKLLIIPPSERELVGIDKDSSLSVAILNWVTSGGTLLILEQNWLGVLGLTGRTMQSVSGVYADLAITTHPAFAGLTQDNFEFWNNPQFGQTARFSTVPLTTDLVAVRGPLITDAASSCILADGKFGQGRIISSQFDAVALWKKDSAASTFLRNLLETALDAPPAEIKPWDVRFGKINIAKNANILFLDMRHQANKGFQDEYEGDNKGGWTDQGDNDFRMMPTGIQSFNNVNFKIIDPETNYNKSCAVLKSSKDSDVMSSTIITVNENISRLFFLHASAFSAGTGDIVLNYRVTYADGEVVNVKAIEGISIADWYYPHNQLSNATLALVRENPRGREVGMFIMEWENPRPEEVVESIQAEAVGRSIAIIAAISGELVNKNPVFIDNPNAKDVSGWQWGATTGSEVIRTGANIPQVERGEENGISTIRINLIKNYTDNARPFVFKKLSKKEMTKLQNTNNSYRYLLLDWKAACNGRVEILIPKDDFSDALRTELHLVNDGNWHTSRILLDDDLQLNARKWGLNDLRGEFYIFAPKNTQAQGAIDFSVGGRSNETTQNQPISVVFRRITLE